MLNSGDLADRADELAPAIPLRLQRLPASRSQAIITPAALAGFFDPAASNPAAFFEAIKKRVKRSDIEMQNATGAHLDELADFITVPRPVLDQGKDQKFRA